MDEILDSLNFNRKDEEEEKVKVSKVTVNDHL